jgi:hypothetical protein
LNDQDDTGNVEPFVPYWDVPDWISRFIDISDVNQEDNQRTGINPWSLIPWAGSLPAIWNGMLTGGQTSQGLDTQGVPSGYLGVPNQFCPPSICEPRQPLDPATPPVQHQKVNIEKFVWLAMLATILDKVSIDVLPEEN